MAVSRFFRNLSGKSVARAKSHLSNVQSNIPNNFTGGIKGRLGDAYHRSGFNPKTRITKSLKNIGRANETTANRLNTATQWLSDAQSAQKNTRFATGAATLLGVGGLAAHSKAQPPQPPQPKTQDINKLASLAAKRIGLYGAGGAASGTTVAAIHPGIDNTPRQLGEAALIGGVTAGTVAGSSHAAAINPRIQKILARHAKFK